MMMAVFKGDLRVAKAPKPRDESSSPGGRCTSPPGVEDSSRGLMRVSIRPIRSRAGNGRSALLQEREALANFAVGGGTTLGELAGVADGQAGVRKRQAFEGVAEVVEQLIVA